jgi:hypothetical protein
MWDVVCGGAPGCIGKQHHTVPELLTAEFHFVPPPNHFCGKQTDNFQTGVSSPSMFGHVTVSRQHFYFFIYIYFIVYFIPRNAAICPRTFGSSVGGE